MPIVIFGAGGQVGKQLVRDLSKKYEVFGFTRKECDISNDDEVQKVLDKIKPSIVINAAAFTDVDGSENNTIEANLNTNELNCVELYDKETFLSREKKWKDEVEKNGGIHPLVGEVDTRLLARM